MYIFDSVSLPNWLPGERARHAGRPLQPHPRRRPALGHRLWPAHGPRDRSPARRHAHGGQCPDRRRGRDVHALARAPARSRPHRAAAVRLPQRLPPRPRRAVRQPLRVAVRPRNGVLISRLPMAHCRGAARRSRRRAADSIMAEAKSQPAWRSVTAIQAQLVKKVPLGFFVKLLSE